MLYLCTSVCLSVCLSVGLTDCLSVCLSVCLLSACLSHSITSLHACCHGHQAVDFGVIRCHRRCDLAVTCIRSAIFHLCLCRLIVSVCLSVSFSTYTHTPSLIHTHTHTHTYTPHTHLSPCLLSWAPSCGFLRRTMSPTMRPCCDSHSLHFPPSDRRRHQTAHCVMGDVCVFNHGRMK